MTRRTIQRATLRVGAALLFLVLVGATYQGVATALERREYPRPGGLVDVGGHQLHIHCTGEGSPAVVLEAPAAGMSAVWGSVQLQIARVTRVCSYDRAGLGWSERPDRPFTPAAVTEELHELLAQANEPAPFVIAGHGLGATFARLFASRFGDDTVAVVLIDAPTTSARASEATLLWRFPGTLPWLARTGLLRASGTLSSMAAGMPQPSGGALSAFLNRPDHLSRTAEELTHWNETTALAASAPVSTKILISRLDAAGPARIGFLGGDSEARSVVAAILDVVQRVRRTADRAESVTPDGPEPRGVPSRAAAPRAAAPRPM